MKSALPALDGLRGLAFLLVMLFHANLLGMGWIGVQLFFVLSGFLITRGLLSAHANAHWASLVGQFWWRRLLRLLPALLAMLALVTLGAALFGLQRWDSGTAVKLGVAGFYYNLMLALDPAHKTAAFGHVWSLGVEMQFYLLWPLLIGLLARRKLTAVLWVLVLTGPGLRWLLLQHGSSAWPAGAEAIASSFVLPTHLDAFSCGALIACYETTLREFRWPRWALPSALMLLAAPGLLANGWGLLPQQALGLPLTLGLPNGLLGHHQFLWGYSLINLAGAVLILACLEPQPTRFLLIKPLRQLGTISYAAYLWHVPIAMAMAPLTLSIRSLTGWGLYPCLLLWLLPYLAIVIAVSWVSTYGLERPLQAHFRR